MNGRPWIPLVALVSSTLACGARPRQDVAFFKYAPDTVELRGTLVFEKRFGPPGYGEDTLKDLRLNVPFLRLDFPIEVLGDSTNPLAGDTHQGVDRVQLTAVPAGTALHEMANQALVVRGNLKEAVWGRQYTQVVIEVISVEKP